ncbi:MAG: hypothetical protein ACLFRV_08350 [Acidimicrobiales bacterium]
MSDDDLYVPQPVGLVAERHRDLQDAYLAARDTQGPVDALNTAIHAVFTESEAADIVGFANGEQDGIYGEGEGAKLVPVLLGNLEKLYQQAKELGLR